MTEKKIKLDAGTRVLSANDSQAMKNFNAMKAASLLAVNVLASPGAGKTSVITKILQRLPAELHSGVIEGDVASSIDTDKLLALGFQAVQINTNGACHLDANMVATALGQLRLKLKLTGPGFVFIENIGNLICPVDFQLGESLRLVVASVPEGDDKPVKYPGIFAAADAVVLNKTDLLGHIDFRMDFFTAGLRVVNDHAPLFNVSCRSGNGIDKVVDWLTSRR
jgi:hydrogenase nickel incorporation protein HypB